MLNKKKIQLCGTSYAFYNMPIVEGKSTAMATLMIALASRCKHAFCNMLLVEEKR